MIEKIIIAGLVIVAGFVFLPGVKDILGKLMNVMNSTTNLTDFERAVWTAMPLVLLIGIFVAAVWVFKGKQEGEE